MQCRLCICIEIHIDLEGAQTDTRPDVFFLCAIKECLEFRVNLIRPVLMPFFTQICICFRGIDVEAIAILR